MKKSLLILGAATMATLPALAGVEPANTYADFDGLKCVNVWNVSRNLNPTEFTQLEFATLNNKIRSSVVIGNQIIYGYSKTLVTGEGDAAVSADHSFLLKHNLYTGAFEGMVEVTVDGQPITGTLPINQIGVDDFGHLWFCGLTGNSNLSPVKLYMVKDLETGEAVKIADLSYGSDEANPTVTRRHDYYDLVGDVTGEKAGAVLLTPVASNSDPMEECMVIGFRREQGSDQWGPGMDDDYYTFTMAETYPADQASWNGAPMVRIVRDDEYSGRLFYVDAFVTCPTLYDAGGTMLDSFASASDIQPKTNCNGCMEFELNGQYYFIYAVADYDTGVGSQVRIARFGEGQAFDGMTQMWDIPEAGLGTISDTGSRMFAINPVLCKDSKGNEAIYLHIAKCNNGMAVYRISGPEFQSTEFEAGVNDITVDDPNAPVEYFNLQGVQVNADNLTPGLYITRQGGKTAKQVVR